MRASRRVGCVKAGLMPARRNAVKAGLMFDWFFLQMSLIHSFNHSVQPTADLKECKCLMFDA